MLWHPFIYHMYDMFRPSTTLLPGWNFLSILFDIYFIGGYATSRKVAGSIPDGVIGIFYWHNPSGRAMALRSIQP